MNPVPQWIWAVFLVLLVFVLLVAFFRSASFGYNNGGQRRGNFGSIGVNQHVFPVGVTPHGIAVTPNGRYAYVANNNNYGITGSDSVTVLNVKTNKVVTTITDASFAEPYTVTINEDGTKAYVTNSNADTVTVIDIATNAVTAVITGFDGPSGLVILPGTNTAYVNNYGGPLGVGSGNGTTVQKVNLETNVVVGAALTVGLAPAALVSSPDGKFVYVINYVTGAPTSGTMSVIQTSDDTVTVTALTGLSGPFSIAINRRGTRAYVTNFGSNNFAPYGTTLSVIDLQAFTILSDVELGIQPSGVAVYHRYALVSNYNTLYAGAMFTDLTPGEGTVQIVDLHTNKATNIIIPVGQSPSQITVSRGRAFVTCYTSNTVHSFDISSLA
jgi:YVTN family beta-propeller protein